MYRRSVPCQSDVLRGSRQCLSTHDRASPAHFLSEIVATVGLILVIFSLARSGRSRSAPAAVGAYIGAAYFFTSSTSFANPAITVGRMFSNTFAGIAPVVSTQLHRRPRSWGEPSPFVIIKVLYPDITAAEASDIMVPHHLAVSDPASATPAAATGSPGDPVAESPSSGTTHDRPAGRPLPVRPQCRPEPGRHVCSSITTPRVGSWSNRPVPSRDPASTPRSSRSSPNAGGLPPENSPEAARRRQRPVRAADVIVTMGCGDTCPLYPGKRYVDWELDDPAGKSVEEVRLTSSTRSDRRVRRP